MDASTLAVGRGVRTNQDGIQQLSNLLSPKGISVFGFDLPLWHGEEACLHLMSVISPLADDLALVYAPLLPAAFYQMLRARGIRLVEGDAEEFLASNGLSLNVLPTAPREVIAVAGFPKTAAAMEAAGCTVSTFEADALCIACEGGPTCLTRPVLRQMTSIWDDQSAKRSSPCSKPMASTPSSAFPACTRSNSIAGWRARRSATSRRATNRAPASWPTAMRAPAAGRASPSSSPDRG